MKVQELVSLIRASWALIIALLVVLTPVVWLLASGFYAERIRALEARIDGYSQEVGVLDRKIDDLETEIDDLEKKKDGFKQLVLSTNRVQLDSLFVPSGT